MPDPIAWTTSGRTEAICGTTGSTAAKSYGIIVRTGAKTGWTGEGMFGISGWIVPMTSGTSIATPIVTGSPQIGFMDAAGGEEGVFMGVATRGGGGAQ